MKFINIVLQKIKHLCNYSYQVYSYHKFQKYVTELYNLKQQQSDFQQIVEQQQEINDLQFNLILRSQKLLHGFQNKITSIDEQKSDTNSDELLAHISYLETQISTYKSYVQKLQQ